MKWSEMTPEQRRRLVAEKMAGLSKEKQGISVSLTWVGPLYKSPDMYFSSSQHRPAQGIYTNHLDYTEDGGFRLDQPCWYVKLELDGQYWWIMADTPQDAIYLASLKVCGVEIEP